jgi:hypothetical protein
LVLYEKEEGLQPKVSHCRFLNGQGREGVERRERGERERGEREGDEFMHVFILVLLFFLSFIFVSCMVIFS